MSSTLAKVGVTAVGVLVTAGVTYVAYKIREGRRFFANVREKSYTVRVKPWCELNRLESMSKTELVPGDHICFESSLPFQHAIVIDNPKPDPNADANVVYFSKEGKRPVKRRVDLTDVDRQHKLFRYRYEEGECYRNDIVADRAKSFIDSRENVEFFLDEQHFAHWCSIGFDLRHLSGISSEVQKTRVRNVGELVVGQHICCNEDTGIVVETQQERNEFEAVIYAPRRQSKPERKQFHVKQDIIDRYDYDVAVGFGGATAAERAIRCAESVPNPHAPPPYRGDGNKFALCCKTGTTTWSLEKVSQWATARLNGFVNHEVTTMDCLKKGDHISFDSLTSEEEKLSQHCIVVKTVDNYIRVIYLCESRKGQKRLMKKESINFEPQKFRKYFYDIRVDCSAQDVVGRAQARLQGEEEGDELPFKDSFHFAIWCKTGSFCLEPAPEPEPEPED